MSKKYYIYIIKAINKDRFYIGYTVDLIRRLKQHNKLLKGGAKSTKGYIWEYYAIFSNIQSHIQGLQLEWKLKHLTKKRKIISKIITFCNWYNVNKMHLNRLIFFTNNDINLNNFYKKIINIKTVNYLNNIIEFI